MLVSPVRRGVPLLCRLLGYVAAHPSSVSDILGADALDSFTSLAALHGDGWGMVWRGGSGSPTQAAKSPLSAAQDPDYAAMTRRPLGQAGLVHLRWATDGLAVSPGNTHPFVDGDYALAHNGSVSPIDRLDEMLTEESRASLVGDTDSERYFRFVLDCLADSDDETHGVLRAVRLLHEQFPTSSLNSVLLTPRRLFAVHVNSRAALPVDDLRSLYGSDELMPTGHATEYFTMAYRVTSESVQVISSGLNTEGWQPVPTDSVLVVDLATRDVSVHDPLMSVLSD